MLKNGDQKGCNSTKVSYSYFYKYRSLYFNTKEPVISKIHYTKTLLILS